MNRTPIASPLLLVGRDATETWHGSDDEYREVGFSPAIVGHCWRVCEDSSRLVREKTRARR
jgi:hypothetical protein